MSEPMVSPRVCEVFHPASLAITVGMALTLPLATALLALVQTPVSASQVCLPPLPFPVPVSVVPVPVPVPVEVFLVPVPVPKLGPVLTPFPVSCCGVFGQWIRLISYAAVAGFW
jgi:hypothetical protein